MTVSLDKFKGLVEQMFKVNDMKTNWDDDFCKEKVSAKLRNLNKRRHDMAHTTAPLLNKLSIFMILIRRELPLS